MSSDSVLGTEEEVAEGGGAVVVVLVQVVAQGRTRVIGCVPGVVVGPDGTVVGER